MGFKVHAKELEHMVWQKPMGSKEPFLTFARFRVWSFALFGGVGGFGRPHATCMMKAALKP